MTRKTPKRLAVTLLEGAREAAAIARGERTSPRVTRRVLAGGTVTVKEPPRYDARRIRALRERLNMSQPVFARSLNASDATVKAWEQGKRQPDGTARRLLEVAEAAPDVFASVVGLRKQRRMPKAGAKRT